MHCRFRRFHSVHVVVEIHRTAQLSLFDCLVDPSRGVSVAIHGYHVANFDDLTLDFLVFLVPVHYEDPRGPGCSGHFVDCNFVRYW